MVDKYIGTVEQREDLYKATSAAFSGGGQMVIKSEWKSLLNVGVSVQDDLRVVLARNAFTKDTFNKAVKELRQSLDSNYNLFKDKIKRNIIIIPEEEDLQEVDIEEIEDAIEEGQRQERRQLLRRRRFQTNVSSSVRAAVRSFANLFKSRTRNTQARYPEPTSGPPDSAGGSGSGRGTNNPHYQEDPEL